MDPSNTILMIMKGALELTSFSLLLSGRAQLCPPWNKLQQPLYVIILKQISPVMTHFSRQQSAPGGGG